MSSFFINSEIFCSNLLNILNYYLNLLQIPLDELKCHIIFPPKDNTMVLVKRNEINLATMERRFMINGF